MFKRKQENFHWPLNNQTSDDPQLEHASSGDTSWWWKGGPGLRIDTEPRRVRPRPPRHGVGGRDVTAPPRPPAADFPPLAPPLRSLPEFINNGLFSIVGRASSSDENVACLFLLVMLYMYGRWDVSIGAISEFRRNRDSHPTPFIYRRRFGW